MQPYATGHPSAADAQAPWPASSGADVSDRRTTRLAEAFASEPELILAYVQALERDTRASANMILNAARHALVLSPRYADLLYFTAMAAVQAGEFELADGFLARAVAINPRYKDALILSARVALVRNDPQRAETCLQTAVAHGADYPDVHMLLANVFRRMGEHQRARRAYERALQLNANTPGARTALAGLISMGTSEGKDELPA